MVQMKGKRKCSGDTFVVNVKCRENCTWQGTVRWVEGQKEIPFRSALELIRLMDSAMEAEETVRDDAE